MPIRELKNKLIPKGSFKAHVLTLMSGTAIAQCIAVAVSPILTRLFPPEDFGVFGVYASVASIVIVVSTLRYEQALMLPKGNKEAAHLFWASLLAVAGITALSLITCILFLNKILVVLEIPALGHWLLLLPCSVFFGGVFLTLNSWSTRQKQFKRASYSQIARAAAVSSVQISSGAMKAGPVGLIGGAALGDLIASLVLAYQVKRDDGLALKEGLDWDAIKRAGKQHSDFPVYSGPQNMLNAVSQNIPVLLFAKFFGPAEAGFYALGVRVIQLPMNLVLISLRQVLFQKASETYNSGGDSYALFKKTTFSLIKIVILPASVIILLGPALFAFVLGKEWNTAGEYARWLVLWLACAFVNPPAILFGQILRKQKTLFIQDVVLLFFRIAAIIIGSINRDPLMAIMLYSSVGVFFNLLIIVWMRKILKGKIGLL